MRLNLVYWNETRNPRDWRNGVSTFSLTRSAPSWSVKAELASRSLLSDSPLVLRALPDLPSYTAAEEIADRIGDNDREPVKRRFYRWMKKAVSA